MNPYPHLLLTSDSLFRSQPKEQSAKKNHFLKQLANILVQSVQNQIHIDTQDTQK